MYKIDDITKLDLSDKKQYAIAKETLDRYELTQSEKKGLLEGIKNRGGGDDGEYRYFCVKGSSEIGPTPLTSCSCECKLLVPDPKNNGLIRDLTTCYPPEEGKCAFKLNLNTYCIDNDGNILLLKDFIDNHLSYNDIFMEMTKEEYEQKSEILKYTYICTSNDSKNPEEDAKFFYNALIKIYNKYGNKRFFDDVCYCVYYDNDGFYRISAIDSFDGEGFSLKAHENGNAINSEYTAIYVTNNRISMID